jgi:fumarylacetoacetase
MLARSQAPLHRPQVITMTSPTPEDSRKGKSWVESANDPALGFPLQSLPYCSFLSPSSHDTTPHLGIGIGAFILDLHALSRTGLLTNLSPDTQAACATPQLNALMRCGPPAWSALRQRLFDLLNSNATHAHRDILTASLVPMQSARFLKPVAVENYTDFYASIHHATNVGKLFRPDQPLLPNYQWIPIGYHGRASSLILSGTEIRRPHGQFKLSGATPPAFAPTTQLDYELEVAAYIGTGNALGSPIPIASAGHHIFGLSLLNDWSARDIQSWEAQPLGPFLGKNFATTLSPWVIPMDALRPYRIPLATPHETLAYLAEPEPSTIDLTLEVLLSTTRMRATSLAPISLSKSNLRDLHWTFAQMIAHHTSNGCNLLEGDILATGTVSGPSPSSAGCLLEITQRGTQPIPLPNGETRTFLEDGDEIILRGVCEKEGLPRITFGECRGTILSATT